MEAFSDPRKLMIIIMLSLVSTFFCGIGFKQKIVSYCLIGLGTGIPTFDVDDYRMWVAGGVLCVMGYWMRKEWDI